jgi:P pilus assembly chaperone PapD
MSIFGRIVATTVMAAGLFASAVNATTVTPVVLDLQTTGRAVTSSVSVTNNSAGPMTVEIVTTLLQPTATGFSSLESEDVDDDLLVSPPSVLIPAGKTQTFRVQWIGDPDLAQSKHYYVGVNQLPVKLPDGDSAVQVVYNFNVLVSVSATNEKPQLSVASVAPVVIDGKGFAAVTVRNTGAAHGYISQHKVKIVATSPTGTELFSKTISGEEFQSMVGYGLVASGQTRTVNVPLDQPPAPDATMTAVLLDERAE